MWEQTNPSSLYMGFCSKDPLRDSLVHWWVLPIISIIGTVYTYICSQATPWIRIRFHAPLEFLRDDHIISPARQLFHAASSGPRGALLYACYFFLSR